jgi:hypothetical protein
LGDIVTALYTSIFLEFPLTTSAVLDTESTPAAHLPSLDWPIWFVFCRDFSVPSHPT